MKTSVALFALALCTLAPARALAAESYDNCTGFVDSVPATISTQGTWCLRKDLATGVTSGAAIVIATNNVTLDCNGFKLGGLAAGESTNTSGISASGPLNITVRNCNIRGFLTGIMFTAGSGHLIEDNRLDNMTAVGMIINGDASVVRRNRVLDTGGRPGSNASTAMSAGGDVTDNIVDGVFAVSGTTTVTGIIVGSAGSRVRGNTVRGLAPSGGGTARGINISGGEMQVEDNNVISLSAVSGIGIWGDTGAVCTGNKVFNYSTPFQMCADGGGNLSH
jgi:hypothetical protein